MKTNSLRINQLSASAYERYRHYLYALDSLNIEAYAEFLALLNQEMIAAARGIDLYFR